MYGRIPGGAALEGTPGGAAGVRKDNFTPGGGSGETTPVPGVKKGATGPEKTGGGAFFPGGGGFFAGGGEATVPETGGGFFTGRGALISSGRPGGGAFFAFATGGGLTAFPVRSGGGPTAFPGRPGGGLFGGGFFGCLTAVGIAFTGMSGMPGEELLSLPLSGIGGTVGRTHFGVGAGTGGTAGRARLVSGKETAFGRRNRV